MKLCHKCCELKELSEFYNKQSPCKACKIKQVMKHYNNNREHYITYQKEYRKL